MRRRALRGCNELRENGSPKPSFVLCVYHQNMAYVIAIILRGNWGGKNVSAS